MPVVFVCSDWQEVVVHLHLHKQTGQDNKLITTICQDGEWNGMEYYKIVEAYAAC